MTRLSLAVLAVAVVLVRPAGTQSDALTDVRIALGGDAALMRITSIRASGKILAAPRISSGHIDVYLEYPDKFARLTRLPSNPPQFTSYGRLLVKPSPEWDSTSAERMLPDLNVDLSVTTTRVGFNGETMLRPDHGVSPYESMLGGGPRQYARFAIPLLTRTVAPYRTEPTSEINAVRYVGDDGATWSLVLDPITHRPSALKWRQITSTSHQAPVADWTMTFRDFRKVGGVTWPYRMVTTLSGKTVEDIRIDKYEINTKISPKVFK